MLLDDLFQIFDLFQKYKFATGYYTYLKRKTIQTESTKTEARFAEFNPQVRAKIPDSDNQGL